MDDASQSPPRDKRRWRGPSPTITASLIGGVCAVLAATLPQLVGRHHDEPTHADAQSQAIATAPNPAMPPINEPIATPLPNLTLGAFTLHDSVDAEGFNFADSTLKFTSQQVTQDGLMLSGFFEWRGPAQLLGRENFVAYYTAATRQLFIEGKSVESPTGELGVGSFSALLTADGRRLVDGTWGSTPGHQTGVRGSWNARR
ncbi:MAG: hypothetical protein QM775_04485 [Pirellulales bacterium]